MKISGSIIISRLAEKCNANPLEQKVRIY